MKNGAVMTNVKFYELGRRGKPVRTIEAGDLAEPSGRSAWRGIADFVVAFVEVAQEARAMQTRMLGHGRYRRLGES
jgi:hypothetical protein